MLISQRMLIRNRAGRAGSKKKTFFSAFMLRSEGTHRMLISQRMLSRLQPRRAPNARNPQRMIKKGASIMMWTIITESCLKKPN